MNRTRPSLKQTGEVREMKNKEGALMGMLRELKIKMVGLRTEIKEIKESWELRVGRIESKMVEMEERLKESRSGEAREKNIEEIAEKAAELVKKNKGKKVIREVEGEVKDEIGQEVRKLRRIIEEKEKKERRNKIVIRRLNTDRLRSIKDMTREFLEQEFEIKEKIKSI